LVWVAVLTAPFASGSAQAATGAVHWYSNGLQLGFDGPQPPVAVVAHGSLTVHSSALGRVECTAVIEGDVFSESGHERGEISALSTSGCSSQAEEEGSLKEIECAHLIDCGKLHGPVFMTAEMPLEVSSREAEVCKGNHDLLSECPDASERVTESVPVSVRRGESSLPWRLDLTQGEREEEEVVLQRIGLHEYGEAGSASAKSTACYQGTATSGGGYEVPTGCLAVTVVFPEVPLEAVFYGTQEALFKNGAGNGLDPSRIEFVEAGGLLSDGGGEAELSGELQVSGARSEQLITAKPTPSGHHIEPELRAARH
jgi:hypothetical protein